MNFKLISANEKLPHQMDDPIPQMVIRREACIYGCIDLSDTKKSLLKSDLDLQLKRLSPFEKYDSYIIWKNNHGMFWLWEAIAEHKDQPNQQSIIPESLLSGSVQHCKLEIIQLETGFEARYWDHNLLLGSQYWAQRPSLEQWNQFLRHHAKPGEQQCPEILAYQQNAEPWHQPSTTEKLLAKARTVNFPLLVAALFLTIFGYQLSSLIQINAELTQTSIEHDQALKKASDIVTARNNAVHQLTIIRQINALSQWPTQIELLAVCNQILSNLNARLLNWKYDNGELLLTLKTENTDSRSFVAGFENSGLFKSVNLNTQSSQKGFSLQLELKSLVSQPTTNSGAAL